MRHCPLMRRFARFMECFVMWQAIAHRLCPPLGSTSRWVGLKNRLPLCCQRKHSITNRCLICLPFPLAFAHLKGLSARSAQVFFARPSPRPELNKHWHTFSSLLSLWCKNVSLFPAPRIISLVIEWESWSEIIREKAANQNLIEMVEYIPLKGKLSQKVPAARCPDTLV